jgi:hypothetical protein
MVANDLHAGPLVPEIEAAARLLEGKRFAAFVVCRRYWRNN